MHLDWYTSDNVLETPLSWSRALIERLWAFSAIVIKFRRSSPRFSEVSCFSVRAPQSRTTLSAKACPCWAFPKVFLIAEWELSPCSTILLIIAWTRSWSKLSINVRSAVNDSNGLKKPTMWSLVANDWESRTTCPQTLIDLWDQAVPWKIQDSRGTVKDRDPSRQQCQNWICERWTWFSEKRIWRDGRYSIVTLY